MIINKKRIRFVDKYINFVAEGQELYVCVVADDRNKEILKQKGMFAEYPIGAAIIPTVIGPVTDFNLKGKFEVCKDKTKEYREFERAYHITDWHGNEHSGTCFQTRFCYPKRFIAPPLERLTMGKDFITSRILVKEDVDLLKHIINMFLEIFKSCVIVDNNRKPITKSIKMKPVQWKILPPGEYPWYRAEKELDSYFEKMPKKNRILIERRHRIITENKPDFMAIGEDSFNGYVVYGYNDKKIFIFEPNEPNNATYVFKGEWEEASKLTKKEIIFGNLGHRRLIHTREWERKLLATIKKN